MTRTFPKYFAMLAMLLALVMCVPVAGVAESMTVEQTMYFTGNETLSFWFSPIDFTFASEEVRNYLDTNFIRDWDENGSIEADELNEHISAVWSGLPEGAQAVTEFGKYGDTLSASIDNASPSLDGLQASITLTNKDNGNTFTVNHTAIFNGLVKEAVTIDTQGTVTDYNGKQVNLEAGQTATITVNHHYDGDEQYTLAYRWVTNNEQNQVVTVPGATDRSYTFTMEDREVSQFSCDVTLVDELGNNLFSSTTEIVQFNLKIHKPAVILNVETSHPVEDNVMTVTEGDMVTIALNPTCEDPAAELRYYWSMDLIVDGAFLESFEPEGVTDTYTFTATGDLDGWSVYADVGGNGLESAYIEYKLVVEPKAEQPEAEAVWNGFTVDSESYTKLVQEDDGLALHVVKGAEVTVKADYAYNGADELESYWHFTDWETGKNEEVAKNTSECTFTFENEGTLMFTLRNSDDLLIDTYVYLYSISEEEVSWSLGINEQTNLLHLIGASYEGKKEYLASRFLRDWNNDGKVELDEINANVSLSVADETGFLKNATFELSHQNDCMLKVEMTGFSSSCDGKAAVITLTSKNGDSYTVCYVFKYAGFTLNPLTASSDDTIEVEPSEYSGSDIIVKAQDGTSITFTDHTEYDASRFVSCEYEWSFYDPATGEEELLPSTGKECTVIKEKEGTLFCAVKLTKSDNNWEARYYAADLADLMPKATAPIVFDVVTTPAVQDDVITVTEGETVTINTNASCADPNVNINYFWAIDVLDENGEIVTREKQDNPSPVFSFTATMEHNGKWVRAVANCLDMECESATLLYQLKVEPKQEEPEPVWNGFAVESTGEFELDESAEVPAVYAVKGDVLTITADYTYEGAEAENITWSFYNWDEDTQISISNPMKSYSFVFEAEGNLMFLARKADGTLLFDKNIYIYEKEAEPEPEEPKAVFSVVSTPAVQDDVITVTEGETVTINTNATCTQEGYDVNVEWEIYDPIGIKPAETAEGVEYSFTAKPEHDGMYICAYGFVEGYDVAWAWFEYELNVVPADEPAPEAVWNGFTVTSTGEIEVDESGEIPSVFAVKGDTLTVTADYIYEAEEAEIITWYFNNWDTNEQVKLDCTDKTYTFLFEDEGDLMILVRSGDNYTLLDKNIYINEQRVNPEPDPDLPVVIFDVETSHPVVDDVLTVTEGDTVTVDTNATISDPSAEIAFFWAFDTLDENGGVIHEDVQDGVGEVFTFTATMDLNGKKLYCWGYAKDAASSLGEQDTLYYTINVLPKAEPEKPVIKIDAKTSHPVVDGVLTMTEGDSVTVELNAACTDPSIELRYYWSFDSYDENGNLIEDTQEARDVLTFTATMDLNGKNLYAEVYTGQNAATADHVEYKLVVVPKTMEPDEEFKLEIEDGLTADSLSEELKAIPELNTPEKVEADITIKVLVEAKSEGMDVAEEQTAVYDVTLMYSEDGGKTFIEASKEHWPASGRLTVTLPYPEGTGKDTHTFVVAHMFTQSTDKHKAGDIEYPVVTNTVNGIQFEVTGLSPIAVAWDAVSAAPSVPPTGDSATPYLWLLGMLMAGAGCIVLVSKRRQNG